MSDGIKVAAERFYRDLEPKLATAQRAGKKTRAKAIHAKISNRRKRGHSSYINPDLDRLEAALITQTAVKPRPNA